MAQKNTQKNNSPSIKTNLVSKINPVLSFKEKFFAYAELMRLGNCVMAAIAVLIGFYLIESADYKSAAVAAISTFLICGAGQAINDYFDSKIDEKTSRNRPIPSGRITRERALTFSMVSFFAGLVLAFLINQATMLVAIIFSILLIAYPMFMNKVKYLGNIVVALGTAITFAYGAAAAGNITPLVVTLSMSAFFSNMAREVTKDIEDVRKDKGTKVTLPMVTKNSKHFVLAYYVLAISVSIIAYTSFNLSGYYLAFTLLGSAAFLYALLLLYNGIPKKSQKVSKIGMLVSLVAFVFAKIK